jgi:hypothetical protein
MTKLFLATALLAASFACASAVHAAEAPASGPAPKATFVLATDYATADGVTDAADALQRCIDENPHRTIYFPDGEYLLSHPIATPADPARAVTLRLSDFAFLKAAPDWAHTSAMVRLGARAPANNNRAPGSVYGLYGGNIDGAGRATGLSIESGRETRVQNVAIKRCHVGIHVKRGANSGSADCDIRDIDMTGNNEPGSVGLLVEAFDNTFTNFRMVDFQTGFRDTKATNAVLLVGEAGGHGVLRDLRLREERLNASDDVFRDYFKGSIHP